MWITAFVFCLFLAKGAESAVKISISVDFSAMNEVLAEMSKIRLEILRR